MSNVEMGRPRAGPPVGEGGDAFMQREELDVLAVA